MDKTLELVLIIMSVVFVLYTAVIDQSAALLVAAVAIVCLFGYRMMFSKKYAKKAVAKKVILIKSVKTKKK